MTPFDARISVFTIFALLTLKARRLKPRFFTVIVSVAPLTVVASRGEPTVGALTRSRTRWYVSTSASDTLSLSNVSRSPFGIRSNASSVGAKRVKGPLPLIRSTSPAARTATPSVRKVPRAAAVSRRLFSPRRWLARRGSARYGPSSECSDWASFAGGLVLLDWPLPLLVALLAFMGPPARIGGAADGSADASCHSAVRGNQRRRLRLFDGTNSSSSPGCTSSAAQSRSSVSAVKRPNFSVGSASRYAVGTVSPVSCERREGVHPFFLRNPA